MEELALLAALDSLDALLKEEARVGMSEDLAARKDAAVAALQAQWAQEAPANGGDALGERLRSLLAANRYSLKWSSLRLQLARLGQPKTQSPASRPRLDLVH